MTPSGTPMTTHGPNSETSLMEIESIIQRISDRLETGLNREALRAISDLLRCGVHPDAIVAVVSSLSQQ